MARFVFECPMRWSDMDSLGHVNNTVYLVYLEQARISMFVDSGSAISGNVVLARQSIDYLRPVVFHRQPLRIELEVTRIGGASFDMAYDVIVVQPGEPDVVAAKATTTQVMYDFRAAAARQLTEAERATLVRYAPSPSVHTSPQAQR